MALFQVDCQVLLLLILQPQLSKEEFQKRTPLRTFRLPSLRRQLLPWMQTAMFQLAWRRLPTPAEARIHSATMKRHSQVSWPPQPC